MRFTLSVILSLYTISSTNADVKVESSFTTYQPGGIQSGPDSNGGSTFVASVTYSQQSNSVLMTGSTWGRFFESSEQILDENYDSYGNRITNPTIVQGCFVADASLPGPSASQQQQHYESGEGYGNLYFTHRQRLRTPSANEACSAIQLFSDTASVLVAGHSEERINQTISAEEMVTETKQLGVLLDLNWNINGDRSFQTVGGQQLYDVETMYPIAMTSRTNNEADGLITVFMQADNEAKHIDVKEGDQSHDPAKYFDYGSGYGFAIAMYDFVEQQVTEKTTVQHITRLWLTQHNTTDKNCDVYINDVVQIASGLIMVVGTTNGQGRAFGSESDQGKDLDGFVAKISPSTGELIIEPGFFPSFRIQSNNNKHGNDWAMAICHDPFDTQKSIYIVGTTEGKMLQSNDSRIKGTSAYIMKFDARHMQPIWTRQIGATVESYKYKPEVNGMACAVTPDGKSVWLGGTVGAGGVVPDSGLSKSLGGKDIVVAKLSTETGDIEFMKQVGSNKDDELALRGGLVTDAYGNAVLVGNTYGSLYRVRNEKETNSDVFVMTVGVVHGSIAELPVSDISKSGGIHIGRIFLWMIMIPTMGMVLYYMYQRRRRAMRRRTTETPRTEVISYLNKFDIEDIELKHSATGGWHCNFVNKLAKGHFVPRKQRPGVAASYSGDFLDGLRRSPTTITAETEHEMLFGDATDPLDESTRSTNSLLFGGEQDSPYSDLVSAYTETCKRGDTTTETKREYTKVSSSWGKEII
jgi:hypothetical protein